MLIHITEFFCISFIKWKKISSLMHLKVIFKWKRQNMWRVRVLSTFYSNFYYFRIVQNAFESINQSNPTPSFIWGIQEKNRFKKILSAHKTFSFAELQLGFCICLKFFFFYISLHFCLIPRDAFVLFDFTFVFDFGSFSWTCCWFLIILTTSWKALSTFIGGFFALVSIYGI